MDGWVQPQAQPQAASCKQAPTEIERGKRSYKEDEGGSEKEAKATQQSTQQQHAKACKQAAACSTRLGEQRQDGDAGMAAHHRHIHSRHIHALLFCVESLGANLLQQAVQCVWLCSPCAARSGLLLICL
jgi:hypothetical protein